MLRMFTNCATSLRIRHSFKIENFRSNANNVGVKALAASGVPHLSAELG